VKLLGVAVGDPSRQHHHHNKHNEPPSYEQAPPRLVEAQLFNAHIRFCNLRGVNGGQGVCARRGGGGSQLHSHPLLQCLIQMAALEGQRA
jgi:hypothetical protein